MAAITRQRDEYPGNDLAFFSSFDYPEKVAALLATLGLTVKLGQVDWRQPDI